MADVSLRNIQKSFGHVDIIKGVSLDIADGEFVVLIGPSGCGKSTLLRMIAGLETISGGAVMIGGNVVNNLPARERGISMVFQSYALYPHMTSAQNMSFSLKLKGETAAVQKDKVARAAGVLGLGSLLDRLPRQLSGGQRQRVAMGRSIVRDPAVFLFDEPLSNLDAKLRVRMRSEIKELHQKLNTTTIYVTHDQIEAMTLADRIVVLRDGEVEQIGTPLDLYDNPRNAFVGSFLGAPSMNFIEATADGAGLLTFEDGDTLQVGQGRVPTGKVNIGFRPEHVMVEASPSDATITADVAVLEPTGSETLIGLRKGGTDLTLALRERFDARPGARLHLKMDQARMHFFDIVTGDRITG
ncbi:MAG: ABC transporter ATP-binding protein [Cypionkella sp.]